MTDPITFGLTLAPKLIGFATAAYTAIWNGGLGKADAKALKSLIEVGKTLRDGWKSRHPDASNLDVMGRHTALVAAAFMAAFRDQDDVFRAGLEKADRKKDIEACLASGLEASAEPEHWTWLLQHDATHSPVYQALWRHFSQSRFDLLSLHRQGFEARFRLAWSQLLATDVGRPLRTALLAATEAQGHQLRYLVAQQMVGWRADDLVGEVEKLLDGASLPLEKMYVEPSTGTAKQKGRPILKSLEDWLAADDHLIGAVTAPFGHGKSLTARMLSSLLAEAWLGPQSKGRWFIEYPPAERWFPIYVPCRQTGLDPEKIQRAVTRALKTQLAAQGEQLSAKEIADRWPDDRQRRLIILDGLDEVHLRPDAQQALAEALQEKTSARCRFLIFTRPAALPRGLDEHCTPFLLRGFTEIQIDKWLTPWNARHRVDITRESIEKKGLLRLAQTPILLYMIALAWPELPPGDEEVPEVEVYSKFFDLLATTKVDLSHQPVVLATAEQICDALIERAVLADDATAKDGLLWLLARLAWEHACQETVEKPLTREVIKPLLKKDLGIEGEIDTVFSGLMLVMRADLTHRNPRFDFSHRSFQEFLIACHWCNELSKANPEDRKLMGARLLDDESKAPRFLLALLKRDTATASHAARWAEGCFMNTQLGHRDSTHCDDPLRDQRGWLREAALMLRCTIDPTPLHIEDARVLASVVRGLEIQGKTCVLHGAGLRAHGVLIQGAHLQGAHLQDAHLPGAHLQWAQLKDAHLQFAHLQGAHLQGARLQGAHLQGARLQKANLRKADLQEARLMGAHLEEAELQQAELERGLLWGAHLQASKLWGAVLWEADLQQANLQQADLLGADLRGAKLQKADFQGADLRGANLTGANLGTGGERVRNLHLAKNLDKAIRPEGWGDLLTNPQT